MSRKSVQSRLFAAILAGSMLAGCSGDEPGGPAGGERPGGGSRGDRRGRGPGGGMPGGPGGGDATAAVPVEVARVARRDISSFIETNGTLEAENEVDVVARISAPITEILAEEGMGIRKGQVLARLDELELRARMEISRVALEEARLAYDRAKRLHATRLISDADYEQARSVFESARAQLDADEIQLGYATIAAPFDGTVVARYVDLAEQVSANTPLFRLSDFDPLLCPIQIPERELPRLKRGQKAHLTVESWPGERFDARVLRVSPVVSAATGTIKVTLEVRSRNKLRPGMFARVFVETETRSGVLVIPKSALSLESIGDTVYVADGGVASRREVELGFREGDFVQIVAGLREDESIIVVGQDGLSDGTPIDVLGVSGGPVESAGDRPRDGGTESLEAPASAGADRPVAEQRSGPAERERPPRPGPRGERPDFATMSPEQLEQAKERMRQRGMSEEQIERMIRRSRERPAPDRR